MELIEVVALAHFSDSRVGGVSRKQRLKLPLAVVEQLEELGLVQRTNPKAAIANASQQTAPLGAGGGASPASLPAAQASTEQIANLPSHKDGESSQSTTAGDSAQKQTRSTLVTDNGGASTTKKSPKSSKANSGLKTKAQQGASD